jgi:hypothetical protein
MEHAGHVGQHEKIKPMNNAYRRKRGYKLKDILINRISAENNPNSKKETVTQVRKLTEHQTVRTKKETSPDTS